MNAGYALSFIKDVAEKLRWAASPAEGSQFRSRDIFPQTAAAIALGFPGALGDDIDRRMIPDPPASVIAYVDGYGNIKTTIAYNPTRVRPGKRIQLRILDQSHEATVSDGAFAVPHGDMAFAPGSSGWRTKQGKDVQWIEVFLRGGNAWERFGRPPIGSSIVISS